MINYTGMKSEESKSNNFGQLPAGPYVAKVLGARVVGDAPDQSLEIMLDVSEGEYKDFFTKKFEAAKKAGNKYGDPKYKGIYRLRIPNESNTNAQYPESDKRRMNDMIFRFEKSNPNFHWTGEEKHLKGLTVGINMQEDEFNGNKFTRIGRLEIAQDVQAGLVQPMQPRKRRESGDPTTIPSFSDVPSPAQMTMDPLSGLPQVNPDELPWD